MPEPPAIDLSVREDVGGCMSLVGNLEDLSLGDLLQIVSMSQKSGVLVLHSASGRGQIVFRSGLVHAAGIKGQAPDLRAVLVQAGLAEGPRLDAALVGPAPGGVPNVEQLAEQAGLPLEQVELPVRKAAESAIFEMFSWLTGEFSFDGRAEGDGDDPFPILRSGINAQYLAMEGMRLRDEQARVEPPSRAGADFDRRPEEPYFGSEPLELDPDDSLELDPSWDTSPSVRAAAPPARPQAPVVPSPASGIELAVERVLEREAGEDRAREATKAARDESFSASPSAISDPSFESTHASAPAPAPASALGPAPVTPSLSSRTAVVVDPDAAALEWIKSAIEGRVARIHVFQRAEEGLARIRQYLIRGEVPVVLIALATPIDPLSGIHGLADFVKRLRAQAARIVVVGLDDAAETRTGARPGHLDGVLPKPTREKLRTASAAELGPARECFVASLAEAVGRPGGSSGAGRGSGASGGSPLSAERHAALESALACAQSQHDISSLLLDAAAGLFARVAVLALREGEAFPVAGRGIEALEIDPLASSPRLSCPAPPTSLLGRVIDSGRPAWGALQAQADRLLAAMFGPIEPRNAYLAPIVGPSGVVAVLYGDQGGHRRPMPDVASLERLVERAGLELGRLALGRARGEVAAREH